MHEFSLNKPETSFWEKESFTGEIDLLVIGAGIVGSSAALFWKKKYPDANVVVADKGLIPEGASTRNAGLACIGSMSEHLDDIKHSNEQIVLGRLKRRWDGLKLLRETVGDSALEYKPCGGYEIFTDPQLYESCLKKIGWVNKELNQLLGEENVYTKSEYNGYPAICHRLEGSIHPGRMMKSIHHLLCEAHIPVWWSCEVSELKVSEVIFKNGKSLTARNILAATNGFTRRIADLPITPARGLVLLTKPVSDLAWKGTFHHNSGYVYFRNVGNRLLIGGARDIDRDLESTDRFGINPVIRKWLVQFVDQTLKLPKDWEIDQEWSGIMGFTSNKEPLITRTNQGIWVAAGMSGMGIAIGMEAARQVVEKI
jgi:gamma-glutamylputrescine oxidase